MYLVIDAIADRDLGFAMARKATSTSTLGKSETQQSISGLNQGTKRMASPDYRNKREDNRGGSGGSADYNGQGSDRLLDVIRSRHRLLLRIGIEMILIELENRCHHQGRKREREEKRRQVSIPPVISWFVGDLPSTFFSTFFLERLTYFIVDRSCV